LSAVVIRDRLVHYEAMGRGRPVVFIHGWLGSWRYWVPAMEELASRYRTYALDLWGFGDSEHLAGNYDIGIYVDLLGAFLDALGMACVPLVGHSLGGLVALAFAAQRPERVEQVLAVSVPLLGEDVAAPLARLAANQRSLNRLAARQTRFSEIRLEVGKTDAEAVVHTVQWVLERDLRPLLPDRPTPVLLLHGQGDPLVRPPQVERLSSLEENLHYVSLTRAAHFPMLEERSKFNRLLAEFLEAGEDLSSLQVKTEWHRRVR
jgi:pimeloyl-ACP methyl ester carboxylesterase